MGAKFVFLLGAVLGGFWMVAGAAVAQSPSPTPFPASSPTPPVTTVEQFPSTRHYLRAFPGPEEDSWYVYASGFTPRAPWHLREASCAAPPCAELIPAANELVKEDGTMSFYVRLPRAADPSQERVLAVVPGLPGGEVIPGAAPSVRVSGHNPGGGFGYPRGTKTGISAIDDVVAFSQAVDTTAIRSRVIERDGTTTSGTPVRGIATWQCGPYVSANPDSNQNFEYPAGLVYAVFRIPSDGELPLRYQDAAFGIAWYDGGAGLPLGGLTLVTANGQIVGTEIRCGTTPGYHVHNFTDFVLSPFNGPVPASHGSTPTAPGAGGTPVRERGHSPGPFEAVGVALLSLGAAMALASRARKQPLT